MNVGDHVVADRRFDTSKPEDRGKSNNKIYGRAIRFIKDVPGKVVIQEFGHVGTNILVDTKLCKVILQEVD